MTGFFIVVTYWLMKRYYVILKDTWWNHGKQDEEKFIKCSSSSGNHGLVVDKLVGNSNYLRLNMCSLLLKVA